MSIRVFVIFVVFIGLASAVHSKGDGIQARCGTPTTRPCGSYFDENDLYGSFVCKTQPDGTMLIAPNKPSDNFFFCIGGYTYLKSCGNGRHFNSNINACE